MELNLSLLFSSSWALSSLLATICILLASPFLHSTKLATLAWLSRSQWTSSARQVFQAITVLLLSFLGISLRGAVFASRFARENPADTFAQLKEAEASQNATQQAAHFLLALLMYRLGKVMLENSRLQVSLEALQKQAKHMSDAYTILLDEKIELEKSFGQRGENKAKRNSSSSSDGSDQEHLAKKNLLLQEKVDEGEKNQRLLEQKLNTMKKQSDALQNEFGRLKRDNEGLRSQLSDYELVFSDERKKNI